jgi:anti-sigma factor RsiW
MTTQHDAAWSRVIQLAPRFAPSDPDALAARIRARLAVTPILAQEAPRPLPARQPGSTFWYTGMAIAATLLCVSISAWIWLAIVRGGATASVDVVAHEVVSSHIRSLMAQHLTDVPSSDRHTVKPWFAGKVPFALNVPDFREQGYVLEGGRLDYVNGRAVAALVYRRRQHAINVFVWPADAGDRGTSGTHNESGYEAIGWAARGQQHWAVSDVNDGELREFIGLFQRDE